MFSAAEELDRARGDGGGEVAWVGGEGVAQGGLDSGREMLLAGC